MQIAPRYVARMDNARNDARRAALNHLVAKLVPVRFKTQSEMATELGFSPAHFSQMRSGNRPVGNGSADKIERGLALPRGRLDAGVFDVPPALVFANGTNGTNGTNGRAAVLAGLSEDERTLLDAYHASDQRMRKIMIASAREAIDTFPERSEVNNQ